MKLCMEFESINWLSRIIIFATVYDNLYCDQYSKLSNVGAIFTVSIVISGLLSLPSCYLENEVCKKA